MSAPTIGAASATTLPRARSTSPSSVVNAVWNGAGTGVEMVTGLLLAPFLIHDLGAETYGVWIVIGSLTSYFTTLDLGIRGSIGRFVAFHTAAADHAAVNRVLMSSLSALCVPAILALAAGVALSSVLHKVIELPAHVTTEAPVALIIVSANVVALLFANVFDAGLWAHRRFDLLNRVDIPITIGRAVLSVLVVRGGLSLVGLAGVTLATTLAAGIAKAVLVRRTAPSIEFDLRHASLAGVREVMNYGVWNSARNIGVLLRRTAAPVLVGHTLGASSVTVFALAARLVSYATLAMNAGAGVLTPVATAHHARADRVRQARLFVDANSLCFLLAGFFCTCIALLGTPFIVAWVGPEFALAGWLALVLAAGELLPMAQTAAEGVLLGMARHRILAVITILDGVLGLLLASLLVPSLALTGVCLGLAISALAVRGLPVTIFAVRLLDIPWKAFVRETVWPAAWRTALGGVVLLAYTTFAGSTGWAHLIGATAAASLSLALLTYTHSAVRARLS